MARRGGKRDFCPSVRRGKTRKPLWAFPRKKKKKSLPRHILLEEKREEKVDEVNGLKKG